MTRYGRPHCLGHGIETDGQEEEREGERTAKSLLIIAVKQSERD